MSIKNPFRLLPGEGAGGAGGRKSVDFSGKGSFGNPVLDCDHP